jgi:CheY-like chemotaxis protein
LTIHFDEFSSSCFITDGLRLQQVIYNLISNAIKYTPELGRIDFVVRVKDRLDSRALLSFAVRDTGIGIAPDKIDAVFHPFEQVETGKFTSGNGLGLTIIRRTLELFGTDIHVQSEPGRGSEFSFDVWLLEDHSTDKAGVKDIRGLFTGQRALVVDDVRLNRLVLVNFLHEAGFEADEAKDGKEALEMFENSSEGDYSIIFMDIQMPVMDGYESAIAIRALHRQDVKTVPIVTISANAFKEDVDKSLASGMNAHFAKPLQKETLSEILVEFCKPTK